MLSNQQFERARRLALSVAGIQLVERHRELLERRSERCGISSGAALESIVAAAENGDAGATQEFIGLLTTRFTGFFRHPRHFEIAARHALQVAGKRRRARLWSAGTATGEEAWSLAMALIEAFELDNPPVNILATDVDVEALAVAERSEYGELSLKTLSPTRRERFLCDAESLERCGSTQLSVSKARQMSDVSGASRSQSGVRAPQSPARVGLARQIRRRSASEPLRIAPFVRRMVEFRALNFADAEWQIEGPFDAILCRNVLMYFESGNRYAVLERMASLLAPGGLLLLDPTEHLGNAGHWFAPFAEGVYSRRLAARAPHRQRREYVGHR